MTSSLETTKSSFKEKWQKMMETASSPTSVYKQPVKTGSKFPTANIEFKNNLEKLLKAPAKPGSEPVKIKGFSEEQKQAMKALQQSQSTGSTAESETTVGEEAPPPPPLDPSVDPDAVTIDKLRRLRRKLYEKRFKLAPNKWKKDTPSESEYYASVLEGVRSRLKPVDPNISIEELIYTLHSQAQTLRDRIEAQNKLT